MLTVFISTLVAVTYRCCFEPAETSGSRRREAYRGQGRQRVHQLSVICALAPSGEGSPTPNSPGQPRSSDSEPLLFVCSSYSDGRYTNNASSTELVSSRQGQFV